MKRLLLVTAGAAAVALFIICERLIPYAVIWYPAGLMVPAATVAILRRRRAACSMPVPRVRERRTTEIGEAWMLTSLLLQRAPSAADRMHLCHVREAYLEELSIRDPDGFQRWVNAALAGDHERPDVYIRHELRADEETNLIRRIVRRHLPGPRFLRQRG